MGYRDENCEPRVDESAPAVENVFKSKTHKVKTIVIEDGAGGGGGGTYVFLLNAANTAVPLAVAGGGGGLGIGRYLDDDLQHGRGEVPGRKEVTGQVHGDPTRAAGPGGGWRANEDAALGPLVGASLLEGGRGGIPCYAQRGIHGQGGFGGGGGGCHRGGGGGGYSGGDTLVNSTNGEGGSSLVGLRRSIPDLASIYTGENSGAGSVIIIPAIQGCGCDYRCIALDEFRSTIACICPEGWRLKRDNFTTCECKKIVFNFLLILTIYDFIFVVIAAPDMPLQYLIVFFAVTVILLVAALTGLIFMLCKIDIHF